VVVLGGAAGELGQAIDRSTWSGSERRELAVATGAHEALGGIALALAAGIVATAEADDALACGTGRGGLWFALFRRTEPKGR
jgi:hypothetical protein